MSCRNRWVSGVSQWSGQGGCALPFGQAGGWLGRRLHNPSPRHRTKRKPSLARRGLGWRGGERDGEVRHHPNPGRRRHVERRRCRVCPRGRQEQQQEKQRREQRKRPEWHRGQQVSAARTRRCVPRGAHATLVEHTAREWRELMRH